MATFQPRAGKVRAIVRRKGFATQSRTFPSKTAARAWADRVERDLAEREASGASELAAATFRETVEWYKEAVRGLKNVSKTQVGNLTRLVEGLGEKITSKLTSDDIVHHAKARVTGNHINCKGFKIPACSPATMTVELGYLSEVIKIAKGMGKIKMKEDPVADARPVLRMLRLVSKSKKRTRRPTADELRKLRTYFEKQAWCMALPMNDIIDFAILTAKRQSEITRLLHSDINTTNKTALLRDAKHPRKKDGNHKRFPLLGEASEIVEQQKKLKNDDRVFPYKSQSVGTAFRRACRACGIDDLTFHDLRHEGTSRLFEQGYDIPEVAAVTLHESWNELKRYTQLRPESLHQTPAKPQQR